jgi:hypothetical protein
MTGVNYPVFRFVRVPARTYCMTDHEHDTGPFSRSQSREGARMTAGTGTGTDDGLTRSCLVRFWVGRSKTGSFRLSCQYRLIVSVQEHTLFCLLDDSRMCVNTYSSRLQEKMQMALSAMDETRVLLAAWSTTHSA